MELIIKEIDADSSLEKVIKPDPEFSQPVCEECFRKSVNDYYEILKESDAAFIFPVDYPDEFEKGKNYDK